VWQASPSCTQKDDGWQVFPLQSPEQHSPPPAQAFPSVLQLELRVAQLPAVHVPLQHWLLPVHAPLSGVHAGKAHAPLLHAPLQHAPFAPHWLPSDAHPPSLPNGLPPSPMVTTPLLLPLAAPLLLPKAAPLLLPLATPLLLPVVASPPPSPGPPCTALLLPAHATKLAPQASTESTATNTSGLLRATIMARAPRQDSFQRGSRVKAAISQSPDAFRGERGCHQAVTGPARTLSESAIPSASSIAICLRPAR
jgi:hypothetical protein